MSYLLGSLNLTIVSARLARIDALRSAGSGNPGVTNLYRVAGSKIALLVLLLEIGKAALAVNLAEMVGLSWMKPLLILPYVLGNLLPVFHGFKGGKGVSAVVGTFLGTAPIVMLLGGAVFLVVFLLFRRVSLGSLFMAFSYPVWVLCFSVSTYLLWVSISVALTILVTHRQNIGRLLSGTEPRLKRGHP